MLEQIKEARAAGYSDADIMAHIRNTRADLVPNIEEALSGGYTDAQIVDHLRGVSEPQIMEEAEAGVLERVDTWLYQHGGEQIHGIAGALAQLGVDIISLLPKTAAYLGAVAGGGEMARDEAVKDFEEKYAYDVPTLAPDAKDNYSNIIHTVFAPFSAAAKTYADAQRHEGTGAEWSQKMLDMEGVADLPGAMSQITADGLRALTEIGLIEVAGKVAGGVISKAKDVPPVKATRADLAELQPGIDRFETMQGDPSAGLKAVEHRAGQLQGTIGEKVAFGEQRIRVNEQIKADAAESALFERAADKPVPGRQAAAVEGKTALTRREHEAGTRSFVQEGREPIEVGTIDDAIRKGVEDHQIAQSQTKQPAHPGATQAAPGPEATGMPGRAPETGGTPAMAEQSIAGINELQKKFLSEREVVGADTSADMGKLGRREYGGRVADRPIVQPSVEAGIEVVPETRGAVDVNLSQPEAAGAASTEAIHRVETEGARYRLDTRTGKTQPIPKGVDGVDALPNAYEVTIQEGIGPGGTPRILDSHPNANIAKAKAHLAEPKAAPEVAPKAKAAVPDAADLSTFPSDKLQQKFLDLMERGEEKGHPLYDAIHDELTARAAKEISEITAKEKVTPTVAKEPKPKAKPEKPSAVPDKADIPVRLTEMKEAADALAAGQKPGQKPLQKKAVTKAKAPKPKEKPVAKPVTKPVTKISEKVGKKKEVPTERTKLPTRKKQLEDALVELGQEEFNHQYNPGKLGAKLVKELVDETGISVKLAKTRVKPKVEKYTKMYDIVNETSLTARHDLLAKKQGEKLGDVEYDTVNVEIDVDSQAILDKMEKKGIKHDAVAEKSAGHEMVVGHWEYFTMPNGKLYRAPRVNEMTRAGYRKGAKWVASGADVPGALEIAKGLARKRGAQVTLDSMGLQSGYEMVKGAVTDIASAKEKFTTAKAGAVKKTITLRAKNIWGKGHAGELKNFVRRILDTKKPIEKLSLRELKKVETGLEYLKNEIGANPGGDPTVITRKGRADYTNVTEPQGNTMRSAYELTDRWDVTKSSKTGTGILETPIRVFEEIGKGVKELFYDRIVEADKAATRNYKAMLKEFKPVIKGIKKAGEKKVTSYAISKQKGGVKALKDMKAEVPTWDSLTGPEQAAYNFMRKKYEGFYKDVNAARVKAGLKPFKKVDNYFTFWNQYQSMLDRGTPMHSISFEGLRGETPFRFKRQRKGTGALWLEGFEIFKNYAEQAFHHELKTPEIAHMNELLGRYEDGFSVGKYKPNTHKFLTDWVNTAAGKPIETAYPGLQKAGRMINENLAAAVLAYNIRSAIIQPTAIVATNTLIGPKYTMRGVEALFNEPIRQFVMDNSVVINREYDVHVRDLMRRTTKVKKKAAEIGLKPLQWLDKQTAMSTWYGAYEMAKEMKGLKEVEAIRFADDTVTKTQASAKEYDLAPIQRNVAGKTLTLFQTFVINHFDMLRKDVLGWKNKLVTKEQAAGRLGRWLVGVTITNILFENILGINSPFPSPINQFKDQMDAGKTATEATFHAAKEFVDVVPMLSSLRYGSSPGGPVIELASDISEAFSDKPGPTRSKAELAGKALGVPGTAQISKTAKRLKWGQSLPAALIGAGKGKEKKSTVFSGRSRSGRGSRSR